VTPVPVLHRAQPILGAADNELDIVERTDFSVRLTSIMSHAMPESCDFGSPSPAGDTVAN
jgi:hypothetical protein